MCYGYENQHALTYTSLVGPCGLGGTFFDLTILWVHKCSVVCCEMVCRCVCVDVAANMSKDEVDRSNGNVETLQSYPENVNLSGLISALFFRLITVKHILLTLEN